MIVTDIQPQKNPDRVNIYLDGNFAFGLEESIRFKYSLKKDMELDSQFVNDILKEEEINHAFNLAIKYLSYRQRSEKEIIEHLKSKDFEDTTIMSVIDKCKYYNYIDDVSFAKSFVKDKINLKKLGSGRIKYELKLKGIDESIISEVLDIDDDVEYTMALSLASKRLSSYKNDDYQKKRSKLSGYLQRRGYNFSIISKVLKEVLTDD